MWPTQCDSELNWKNKISETQTNVEKLMAAKRKCALLIWAFVIELKNFIREKTSFKLIPWSMAHLMLWFLFMALNFTHSSRVECSNVNYGACFFILHCMFWVSREQFSFVEHNECTLRSELLFRNNTNNFISLLLLDYTFHENKLQANKELKCIFRFSCCFSFILFDICFQFA